MTGLLAVAVCPHPPALVPGISPGADAELKPVRRACDEAVRTLLGSRPDHVVVIGAGELAGDRDETAGGSLAAYGVDVRAGGPTTELPLSLTIGAWLLDRTGWTGRRTYSTGRPDIDGRVALLVMADGSARRSVQAPGYFDERAEPFDASIAAALAAGDPNALTALDPDLGEELAASGVPILRRLGEMTRGADVTPRLWLDAAPLGVGYVVAGWTL